MSFTRTISILLILMLATLAGYTQIRGNGKVVSQERNVDNFTGVVVRSGIDLTVKQGDQPALSIEADENLQEFIISEVREEVLYIYVKKKTNIRKSTRMDAHVTVTKLKKLSVSGGGDVESLSFGLAPGMIALFNSITS